MPEEIVPAPEVAVVPEPPKEFRYEYQPKDESGNPLGNKQVVIATTPEEAVEKIAQMHQEAIKFIRKQSRDLRLGVVFNDEIPQDAPRVKAGQYEIEPIPLTAEERLEVTQNINDPENFEKAARLIVRSQIGDPDAVRAVVGDQKRRIAAIDAREQAEAFVRSTPDYFVCPQNFETIANWMIKNDLEPVKANFKLAFEGLKEYLVSRPVVEPVVPAPVPTPVAAPVAETPAAVASESKRPVSSGLTRENSSDSGPVSKKGYTPAEIDKMSADEYKQKVLVPEFRASRQKA